MTTIARTYQLRSDTVQELDELAAKLEIWQSPLVEVLLSIALEEVAAGRLIVRRRVVKYEVDRVERKGDT